MFSRGSLAFSAPNRIGLGRNFIVSVKVGNDAAVGSSILETREYLYVDGVAQGYKRVALAPGESKVLIWPYVKLHAAGNHHVAIGEHPPKTVIAGEDHFFPVDDR